MVVLWTPEEQKQFVSLLDAFHQEGIITLRRSSKGHPLFDGIDRKITIHAHRLNALSSRIPLHLFPPAFALDPSYYLKNPIAYQQDEKYIVALVQFLKHPIPSLTLNEISYLIFGDEKAISQPEKASVQGARILKHLNLPLAHLGTAETIAPFYFPIRPNETTVLIIENKETCFSIFRLLTETETNIKGIIYGEGRAILKIFGFIHIYGLSDALSYIYYGDIDQEGLDIAAALIQKYPSYAIGLSTSLYPPLAQQTSRPLLQKRMLSFEEFPSLLTPLPQETQEKIMSIVTQERCIPQEALHFQQLKEIFHGLRNQLY